jgi:hypothetical protein
LARRVFSIDATVLIETKPEALFSISVSALAGCGHWSARGPVQVKPEQVRRKRVGRVCDWNPAELFGALGITVDAKTPKCAAEGQNAGAASARVLY